MEQVNTSPEAIPHHSRADSFDVRKQMRAVLLAYRSHRKVAWISVIVALVLVSLYILVWPPVYRAEVVLAATSAKDEKRDEFYSMWANFRRSDLTDEVQLFTSKPVLAEVAKRLDLKYDEIYHPPLSHLAYLWQSSWPGRGWRATKNFLFPRQPGKYVPTQEEVDFGRTVNDFQSGVHVVAVGDTNIGQLVVVGPTPRVAEIANEVVKVYFEKRRDREVAEAREAADALRVETKRARTQLLGLEQDMERYYTDNDMLLMFEKDKIEVSQWLTTRATVEDLQANIAANQSELRKVRALLAAEPSEVVSSKTMQRSISVQELQDKIAQAETQKRIYLLNYRPDAPEVRELDRQMGALRAQLATMPEQSVGQSSLVVNPEREALRSRASQLEQAIAGSRASLDERVKDLALLQTQVDTIPEKMKVSHDLGREHEALEKKLLTLNDKLMIAEVSAATAGSAPSPIWVVDPASVPDKPSQPKTKLLLIAAVFFGFIAGIVGAVLLDIIRGDVSRARLAEMLPGLRLYGVVGRDPAYTAQLFQR